MSGLAAAAPVPREDRFPGYRQSVVVTFDSEAAARAAELRSTPLWDGREWAVSGRWDDVYPGSLRMRGLLERLGQRATFYLNGPVTDWETPVGPQLSGFARELLRGGNSLGGHSMSHPYVTLCHRNRIFEEIAGVRILWEAAADAPILSYAFSYSNFWNDEEGDEVQSDIIRCLERAGYYHVANERHFSQLPSELILSPILPADGAPIDEAVRQDLANPEYQRRTPILTHSMHATFPTEEAWQAVEARIARYGGRDRWWYCNQNEYAAYRRQYLDTRILGVTRQAREMRVELERPFLTDLNDAVPLTFEVAGAAPGSVLSVRCGTADCRVAEPGAGDRRFDLFHDRDQALPARIGLVRPNLQNEDLLREETGVEDFPGLSARLLWQDGEIRLRVSNGMTQSVARCRVTYRLPLAWNEGVTRRDWPDLAPGAEFEDRWRPSLRREDHKFTAGRALLVAQLDFRAGSEPGRLHAVSLVNSGRIDASYPQGGFLRIGHVPTNQVDLPRLLADFGREPKPLRPWRLDDDSTLDWAAGDGPLLSPYLDVEWIRMTGLWAGVTASDNERGYFVLGTVLHSERSQDVRFETSPGRCVGTVVNGVSHPPGAVVSLRAGPNDLSLVCQAYTAVFFRVCRPGTRERVTEVRFEAPSLPGPGLEPYLVPLGPTLFPGELWISRRTTGDLQIEWDVSGVLQSAPSPRGPWRDETSVRRTKTVEPTESGQYFRLRPRE
jgi:hypothetical protein